jgi:hypothetical protein
MLKINNKRRMKMSLYNRLMKKIAKLEKNIEKKQHEIEKLNFEYDKKLISDYDFISQKKRIEEKIKTLNNELRILKGLSVKRKRQMEEKIRKKREQKSREKTYLNWSKKDEIIKLNEK